MSGYELNVDRNKIRPSKRAVLDKLDEILDKNRSDESKDLCKQIGYLDVGDLLKYFTI